jgi:hypothetical protein
LIQSDIINFAVDYLIPAIFDAHYDDFEFKGREMLYNYYSLLEYDGWNTTLLPEPVLKFEKYLLGGPPM